METTTKTAAFFDSLADERDRWIEKNCYFYREDWKYMRFLIRRGASVLEIGCGTGRLLQALEPSRGVGVDVSRGMIAVAKRNFPELELVVGDAKDPALYDDLGGTFDYVVISDTIGLLDDCDGVLAALRAVCDRDTRIVVAYYNHHWDPVIRLGGFVGRRMPMPEPNWLPSETIAELLYLAGYQVVSREWRLVLPLRLLGIGTLVNRSLGSLPWLRKLGLRNYMVARPLLGPMVESLSASIVVPCRNELGNIEPAIERLPRFCSDLEVIFVEGHSKDGTYEECLRVQGAHPEWRIKVLRQEGRGKADAVYVGFDAAEGDVLMILDADLTVPPEDLPRFYRAIVDDRGEFINGSRLVYPMENQAMRFLNLCANWVFGRLFSFLLNQRFTDTLCGTKVFRRRSYDKIVENRSYFGDFDPFGDFDLIFGAAKAGLKSVEIPVRYKSRLYGETQISRFRHGWLLLRMVFFAFRKLKAF